jgi:MoxR-like ATPase
MTTSPDPRSAPQLRARLERMFAETVVGKSAAVEILLVAVLCEGHVLIEDVPGTGKTLLAKTLARALGLSFRRIQFTPDLLPSDITGAHVFNQRTQEFEFRPGPLFAQLVLADEINRATPRTQSALLEAMEEGQITADGTSMALARPFLVVATQNPVELEGTFPLPEAQLDRFLCQLRLGYPTLEEEHAILQRNAAPHDAGPRPEACLSAADIQWLQRQVAEGVHASVEIGHYLLAVVRATRQAPELELGASPRAGIALYRSARALALLRGRGYVIPDDIKHLAGPVVAHRLVLTQQARLKGQRAGDILARILDQVPVPVEVEPQGSASIG